jgi:hypothetical protein
VEHPPDEREGPDRGLIDLAQPDRSWSDTLPLLAGDLAGEAFDAALGIVSERVPFLHGYTSSHLLIFTSVCLAIWEKNLSNRASSES